MKLCDVFVDWLVRLSREIPGLVQRLRDVCAARVLDVGYGTCRHVQALLAEGFDANASDMVLGHLGATFRQASRVPRVERRLCRSA
jgi:hypothetical protein